MDSSPQVRVSLAEHVGVRAMGSRVCFIDQKRSAMWIYNRTGQQIWEFLARGETVSEVAQALANRYSIPRDRALADVLSVVAELSVRDLVTWPDGEPMLPPTPSPGKPHNRNGILNEAALDAQVPATAIIDLLVPCNLRCRHCYLDFSQKDIVPFETVCRYLRELAEEGCPEIVLTGGEIFLRKDLLDIIDEAQRLGFLITLLTNGQFIDQSTARELGKRYLKRVQISLYGSEAEIHERITRKPGSFTKSVDAARFMIAEGVPVHFSYFIQRDNFEDAFGFREFAASLGATCSFDSKLVPNRNGSLDPLHYGLSIEQQAEVYRQKLMNHNAAMSCSAAVAVCRITAAGEVFPCELMNTISIGNVSQTSFHEVWQSQRRRQIRTAILNYAPNGCSSCSHTASCEPCAALRGFGADGALDQPVTEACMLTASSLVAKERDFHAAQQLEEACQAPTHASPRTQTLVQIVTARLPQAC